MHSSNTLGNYRSNLKLITGNNVLTLKQKLKPEIKLFQSNFHLNVKVCNWLKEETENENGSRKRHISSIRDHKRKRKAIFPSPGDFYQIVPAVRT